MPQPLVGGCWGSTFWVGSTRGSLSRVGRSLPWAFSGMSVATVERRARADGFAAIVTAAFQPEGSAGLAIGSIRTPSGALRAATCLLTIAYRSQPPTAPVAGDSVSIPPRANSGSCPGWKQLVGFGKTDVLDLKASNDMHQPA